MNNFEFSPQKEIPKKDSDKQVAIQSGVDEYYAEKNEQTATNVAEKETLTTDELAAEKPIAEETEYDEFYDPYEDEELADAEIENLQKTLPKYLSQISKITYTSLQRLC